MNQRFIKGNEAIAEAAVLAGCRFFAGYPITPQNEIPEYLSWRLPELGGVFVQAESEVSAINMVYGAAAAGVRAMTSSSGPGISLKQEGISTIAGAQLPCVIVDVMRAGPGLGSIQPSQADYFQATRGGGHGDYRVLVYAPATIQEAVDLMGLAFDKADEYRNPVMLLADGLLAQMMEPAVMPQPVDPASLPAKSWAATGWGGQGRPRAIIKSLNLNTQQMEEHNLKLGAKYKAMAAQERRLELNKEAGDETLIVAYGSCARIAVSALEKLRAEGRKLALARPVTLWPFPDPELKAAAAGVKRVLVLEMSAGQMIEDVRLALKDALPIHFYGRQGGLVPTVEEICAELRAIEEARA